MYTEWKIEYMFNGNKFYFNNIQGKVKKMEGVNESRKENQTKGGKKGSI